MLLQKYNTLFIHIPRTGGTSIENTFGRSLPLFESQEEKRRISQEVLFEGENPYNSGGIQHAFAGHILTMLGKEYYQQLYKFSFVRNPWDRAVSGWSFAQKSVIKIDGHQVLPWKECSTFEVYLETIQKKYHIHWEEQWKFLCDEDGNFLVNEIYQFEKLSSDIQEMLEKIGFQEDRTTSHKAPSFHPPYRECYTDETRALVAKIYAKDIEMFGYEF